MRAKPKRRSYWGSGTDQPSLTEMAIYARDYIARCERFGARTAMAPENILKLCRALIEATSPPRENGTEQAPGPQKALPPAHAEPRGSA